ncbi:glycoside hydrolase family 16 protein [Ferruginibacter profundus]
MNQLQNLFASAIVVIGCTTMLAQCKPAAADVPATTAQNMPAVFFDDFSGSKLDSTKWNVETTGMHFNNELQAYVDSANTISFVKGDAAEGAVNGALMIQPKFTPGFVTKDGQKFDFISGRMNTKNKFEVAYGTVAARIKLSDGAGLWPAWWMLGNGGWPETGEIDIMEYIGEKDWASAAVHGKGYSGDAGLVNRLYFPAGNDVTKWHVYAVDWTPDSLVFKYDDVPMLRITKPMAQFFGPWAFDNPKFLILNFAVGGIYPFKINGIKEPYYGLPAATFEAIKNGQSKMLVDWVRVTKKQ